MHLTRGTFCFNLMLMFREEIPCFVLIAKLFLESWRKRHADVMCQIPRPFSVLTVWGLKFLTCWSLISNSDGVCGSHSELSNSEPLSFEEGDFLAFTSLD